MITHLVVAKHTPLDDTEATKFDELTTVEEYQRGLGSGRDGGGGVRGTGEGKGWGSGRDGGGGVGGTGEGK